MPRFPMRDLLDKRQIGMLDNGLNKSAVPWPMLIGLVLFGLAIWFIHRELAHLDLRTILKQITAMSPGLILLAVAATAGSYLSLTGYDRLALHWIERPFAYRRIALASFTSYALANNVGFGVLSGGAVRYKLYGGWGLSAADIAKVVGFVALTTALGMSTILGIAAIGEGQRCHAAVRETIVGGQIGRGTAGVEDAQPEDRAEPHGSVPGDHH